MKSIIFKSVKVFTFVIRLVLVAILAIACNNQTISSAKTLDNQEEICTQDYNPNTDYFPEKITVDYAIGFNVDYRKNYKIVTVKNPWRS
ncbi:hypothetical protein [Mastigocoleus sp. MO_188.B34]|uniref:hypothetical protein n=1 Tax=Mastigocoleus sp. MO_188.B34 TaxID=3036635 RepID=UPI002639D579|nr:hypothetical protein [Mastigocoleus sp. MO_188.B34]MDJ0695961.1 hypothetical protein [Mastigocoleus sp. MO_188.B34]